MGWKGTVRSIGAAIRAAERDAQRRQRELERERKHYAKMQELEQAAYEVEVYKNRIELLTSVHKECSAQIDWKSIVDSGPPATPLGPAPFTPPYPPPRTPPEAFRWWYGGA